MAYSGAMALTTILSGCDLSAPSDNALERAIALAELHRARLVLVHAQADAAVAGTTDSALVTQLGEVSAAVQAAEVGRLTAKLAEIQARGVVASVISRVGPPDEVLTTVATEEHADLIVVGTHGHTGLARFLLGSVATTTLRRAPCDVLVVRGEPVRAVFTKPLVAADFSPAGAKALGRVAELLAPGTPVHVIHAWQLPAGSWGATLLGQTRFPWNTVHEAVLSSVQAQADKLAADHDTPPIELIQGPPAQVITEAAARGGYDLIVVGAHGKRGFRRLLLGSVAEATVGHAPCSVLVVQAERQRDPAGVA
jgi:nucleotide-binding universal stress UspA family protein